VNVVNVVNAVNCEKLSVSFFYIVGLLLYGL